MADDLPARESAGSELSDDELRRSFSVPAVFSNRILASNMTAGLRLTFMEANGEKVPSVARFSVLLSYADAAAVRDLIGGQLEKASERGLHTPRKDG